MHTLAVITSSCHPPSFISSLLSPLSTSSLFPSFSSFLSPHRPFLLLPPLLSFLLLPPLFSPLLLLLLLSPLLGTVVRGGSVDADSDIVSTVQRLSSAFEHLQEDLHRASLKVNTCSVASYNALSESKTTDPRKGVWEFV